MRFTDAAVWINLEKEIKHCLSKPKVLTTKIIYEGRQLKESEEVDQQRAR